jgi:hypothetical protein
MNLHIRIHGLESTPELTQVVERYFHFALGRFRNRVRKVEVHLTDLNGPRGGPDKECRVLMKIMGRDTVVIREVDSELNSAVARAAERAGRAAARHLSLSRGEFRGRPLRIEFGD